MQSVEQALAALGRVERHLAEDARAAWEHLTCGAGPESLTQSRLQQYCWDELPGTWIVSGSTHLQVAMALAALLDGLGLHRYAEIVRSDTTREVLSLSQMAPERARAVARKAAQRSGIEPPSTELLTWGAVLGPAEAFAMAAAADTLELAVTAGELVPGARNWRDRQAEITVAVLTGARPELYGDVHYDRILDERLAAWVRGARSTTRSAVLTPVASRLRHPVEPPSFDQPLLSEGASTRPNPSRRARRARRAASAVPLRPLAWLLAEIGDGLALTAAGYLPPRTVGRALDELGWREELIGASSREVDVFPVMILRETAARLGLIRRRGARLLLTPSGRAALGDPAALWSAVAGGLIGPDHSALAATWEVVLAVLENGDSVPEEDVGSIVQAVVTESGWRVAGRRQQPSDSDTGPLFFAALGQLRWLELVEESGALLERRLCAHPQACDLFRAALRHRVLHRDVVLE